MVALQCTELQKKKLYTLPKTEEMSRESWNSKSTVNGVKGQPITKRPKLNKFLTQASSSNG